MKSYGVTIQMEATEQYFLVVLFIMLYKVILTFESVNVDLVVTPMKWPIRWKLLSSNFLRGTKTTDNKLVHWCRVFGVIGAETVRVKAGVI